MKKGWILAVVMVYGCAGYQVARVPQPQGTSVPAIYAAAQIGQSATRNQALRQLAYRDSLTESELLYMIDLLSIRKGTSEQLRDVLLTILNNPSAGFQTKQRISGAVPNLGLAPLDQKELVDALAPRPTQSTKDQEAVVPPSEIE